MKKFLVMLLMAAIVFPAAASALAEIPVELADVVIPVGSLPQAGESNTLVMLFVGLALSAVMVAVSATIIYKRWNV